MDKEKLKKANQLDKEIGDIATQLEWINNVSNKCVQRVVAGNQTVRISREIGETIYTLVQNDLIDRSNKLTKELDSL